MSDEEINDLVMAKYPKDPEERHCALVRNLKNSARQDYRIKLHEQRAKGLIQSTDHPSQQAV